MDKVVERLHNNVEMMKTMLPNLDLVTPKSHEKQLLHIVRNMVNLELENMIFEALKIQAVGENAHRVGYLMDILASELSELRNNDTETFRSFVSTVSIPEQSVKRPGEFSPTVNDLIGKMKSKRNQQAESGVKLINHPTEKNEKNK
jgi:hypothetical protein